ncbi:MAG: hypothetical protein RSD71_16820 [Flavobacterium sp.]|uniref:HAAS signaling domain-containing protein n=1 Tax=Flavobacterium sp. TaxID=239 RepID=UPI002FC6BDDB
MKFKELTFKDQHAERIYKDYIGRVRNSVKTLNSDNQNETLLEINSHIYEALQASAANEKENLSDVLQKLGSPEQFLKELVAEKKLEEAASSFNPLKILKALILNFGNGFSYIVFFILYVLLAGFIFMIYSKITNPEQTGFFYTDATSWVLGISQNSDQHEKELLGNWFIPVMILLTIFFYVVITLLLRFKKRFLKK